MKEARSGDRIYLTKGVHECLVSWIDDTIELIGLEPEGVELVCNQVIGDVFLFISPTGNLKLTNITVRVGKQLKYLFVVKGGVLTLDNCVLDCNHLVSDQVILAIDNAQVNNLPATLIINVSK